MESPRDYTERVVSQLSLGLQRGLLEFSMPIMLPGDCKGCYTEQKGPAAVCLNPRPIISRLLNLQVWTACNGVTDNSNGQMAASSTRGEEAQ